jgi:site-specific DNA-methyltransferase (adenine-specific)
MGGGVWNKDPQGRWPPNVIHDGSDEVLAGFPETGAGDNRGQCNGTRPGGFGNVGADIGAGEPNGGVYPDSGSAARYFYCAKAGKLDRLGSDHPTIKPVHLKRWLVRLVTPPSGLVLDPFAGSGATGVAAAVEGFRSILIELRPEAVADIERRLAYIRGEGRTTAIEAARLKKPEARGKARGDDSPLFAGLGEKP